MNGVRITERQPLVSVEVGGSLPVRIAKYQSVNVAQLADRKSGVWGKSGELGGRRHIKKKTVAHLTTRS